MKKSTSNAKARVAPVCIRLTEGERARLVKAANGKPLSRYIREQLLHSYGEDRAQIAAQALAILGDSGIAGALQDLADAANSGLLIVSPEVIAEIRAACAGVESLRADLLRLLGLRPKDHSGDSS